MKRFGFYILGKKGYKCLASFIAELGSHHISFVISARDHNIEDDFFEPIKKLCLENRISFSERSQGYKEEADFSFAIGWRWLISESEGLIVFHDSLLPKYRGFSPLVNALINGENEIGVTALKAGLEYDCGDIISQRSVSIRYPLKISDAIDKISSLYSQMLVDVCRNIMAEKKIEVYEQDSSKASYSLWRNEVDYRINWRRGSEYIARFINAVGYPYRGAETIMNGNRVRILECEVVEDVKVEAREEHIGKIIFMHSGVPTVVCGDGLINLIVVVDCNNDLLIGKIPFRSRFGF